MDKLHEVDLILAQIEDTAHGEESKKVGMARKLISELLASNGAKLDVSSFDMNKQQTAVEWLYDQIPLTWTIKGSAKKIFEQAKEMEKEQLKTAVLSGIEEFHDCGDIENEKLAEKYYNETYGKE